MCFCDTAPSAGFLDDDDDDEAGMNLDGGNLEAGGGLDDFAPTANPHGSMFDDSDSD